MNIKELETTFFLADFIPVFTSELHPSAVRTLALDIQPNFSARCSVYSKARPSSQQQTSPVWLVKSSSSLEVSTRAKVQGVAADSLYQVTPDLGSRPFVNSQPTTHPRSISQLAHLQRAKLQYPPSRRNTPQRISHISHLTSHPSNPSPVLPAKSPPNPSVSTS